MTEQTYIFAIAELYRYSPAKARQILDTYATPEEAWSHIREARKEEVLQQALREQDFVAQHQLHTFYYRNEDYPYRLRECPDAPVLLLGKGNIQCNKGKMVSIVGTRQATERGRQQTERLVTELSRMVPDVTIISGLAYGIDIAAHRAANKIGLPTLIIPAHGLDRIYPPLHRPDAIAALEKGGILTEYFTGTNPDRFNFVARNRIVAGMADAVVVVESKQKGGSLITANLAMDYGRDVFAYPGRPSDEQSLGCNELIRDHRAGLIDSAEDLIRAMQWDVKPTTNIQTELVDLFCDLTPIQTRILDLLRQAEDGMHVNQLVTELEKPYADVSTELAMMEMDDLVQSLPGGVYRALK